MRISELAPEDVAKALRIDGRTPEEMPRIMATAIAYIEGYTGIPAESDDPDADTLDNYPDMVQAYLVLCQDCYDNRSYVQEGTQGINMVVDSILGMHRRALVC